MKRTIKKVLKRIAQPVLEKLESDLENLLSNEVCTQKTLMQYYRLMAAMDIDWRPDFQDIGFRKYSQFEEDGILLCIFSLILPVNRTCVEICAGNGIQCNTSNLIINHGWWGHLLDGVEQNVAHGINFFSRHKDTFLYPPRFTKAWVSAENVNELIAQSGASGSIGLLSLDIDGMDYWVWKAITVIDPQVVVCETHNPVPPELALTVPYDPNFVFESENYRGASLAAMRNLGLEKGYRLVGTHRFGFNAFFIKNGVGEKYFPEVDVVSCAQDPFSKLAREKRWPQVKEFNWQHV